MHIKQDSIKPRMVSVMQINALEGLDFFSGKKGKSIGLIE